MVKEGWQEEGKNTIFYYAEDNSVLDKLYDKIDDLLLNVSDGRDTKNLGLHKYNNHICSSNYVGICRLKDIGGNNIKIDGKEVVLKIEPRFSLSVIQLLNYIKNDDEFDRYLAPQTTRYNVSEKNIDELSMNEIFHFFEEESPIQVNEGFAMDNSIITVTVFLTMLKNLCKRPLMGKMIKKEENLVGKIKGKILFHQNIKNNTIRGRDDRFYCRYLKYSENILENQVLKAAFIKSKRFIMKYFADVKGANNSYIDIISFCNKSLAHISESNVLSKECDSLKFSGCYSHYKPVIKMAKMILDEISIESSGKVQISNYVIPYAISMEKLFEVYVRAYLKQNGVLSYKENAEIGIQLLKFDEKVQVFDRSKPSKNAANYISGTIKPDIVLKNLSNKRTAVFDVKYKNYKNTLHARNDRLQLLAYSMMYAAQDIGLIFPPIEDEENFIFEEQKLNSNEDRIIRYHQLMLNLSDKNDNNRIAEYISDVLLDESD